ncbi:hypothetical protein [Paraburkholderia fungorum]|uniref:hypothetical protein n=1 Tax=Paraburkholderia fungorum TaxID=134537 RepID=UPI0038B7B4B8
MWSSDAAQNLVLSQSSSSVASTSICPTPDGGFYVSWLDFANGYSLYLQRLDVEGNEMWQSNGKLICRRDIQSVIKYGLSVDPDGNAILGIDSGYPALHQPGGVALAFKVSPAGELLWGSAGIPLSPREESVAAVLCCATDDHGAVFLWGTEKDELLRMAKLDATGNRLWATSITPDTSKAMVWPAGIIASDDGSVIYAFIQYIGSTGGTWNSVFTQKLAAADGAQLWGDTPVMVIDSSVATAVTLPMGVVPTLMPDGAGGAVYGYSLIDESEHIYVQRVNSTGHPVYTANGLRVSGGLIDASAARFGFDAAGGRLYTAWNANYVDATGEDMSGVRAQCIDNAGMLLWDEAGAALAPYEPFAEMSPVAMLPVTGGVLAAWVQHAPEGAYLPQLLRASLLEESGTPVWQNAVEDIKSSGTNTTSYAVGALGASGYGAFAWTSDDYTVRAQNINQDGTLGVAK